MNNNVNAIVDKIIADAEKKVRTDLKSISSKAKHDFIEKAKEAVLLYYSSYSPVIYQRTYNLQDNVVDTDMTFMALNGNGYEAWIEFNSSNMSEYSMGSKDVVVSNFMHGIHGRPSVAVDSESAMNLMDNFQKSYKKTLDKYFVSLGYKIK
jgi:hypothetical protein